MAATFGVLAWTEARNLTPFAFFALPIMAATFKNILPDKQPKTKKKIFGAGNLCLAGVLLLTVFLNRNDRNAELIRQYEIPKSHFTVEGD